MGSKPDYGQVAGPLVTVKVPAAASQNFERKSGKFVYSASGYMTIAASGADELFGWALVGDVTTGTTAGDDELSVNISPDAVYEMPIDTAQTEAQLIALIGKCCDIVTTSNIQYADHDAATDLVLQIVGYRYYESGLGGQTLYVRLNPAQLGQSGVV